MNTVARFLSSKLSSTRTASVSGETSGLIRHLRAKLAEAGTEAFPVISFIARSELRDRDLEALRLSGPS